MESTTATTKDVEAHPTPGAPGTHVPEWELPPIDKRRSRKSLLIIPVPNIPDISPHKSTFFSNLKAKLQGGRKMPGPFSMSVRMFVVAVVAVLAFLALVLGVGLGVGLKKAK